MIINEKQHPNDPIVGCEYVFPGDIDSETRIGSNKILNQSASPNQYLPETHTHTQQ